MSAIAWYIYENRVQPNNCHEWKTILRHLMAHGLLRCYIEQLWKPQKNWKIDNHCNQCLVEFIRVQSMHAVPKIDFENAVSTLKNTATHDLSLQQSRVSGRCSDHRRKHHEIEFYISTTAELGGIERLSHYQRIPSLCMMKGGGRKGPTEFRICIQRMLTALLCPHTLNSVITPTVPLARSAHSSTLGV